MPEKYHKLKRSWIKPSTRTRPWQGRSDGGGYRYLYPNIPPKKTKSAQINFYGVKWRQNGYSTVLSTPKTFIPPPKKKFLATPLVLGLRGVICHSQGWRIHSVRILFSERYVRTLTYSILAYVNKNRIRKQTMIAETANWFFATFIVNLLPDSVVQNGQFN